MNHDSDLDAPSRVCLGMITRKDATAALCLDSSYFLTWFLAFYDVIIKKLRPAASITNTYTHTREKRRKFRAADRHNCACLPLFVGGCAHTRGGCEIHTMQPNEELCAMGICPRRGRGWPSDYHSRALIIYHQVCVRA